MEEEECELEKDTDPVDSAEREQEDRASTSEGGEDESDHDMTDKQSEEDSHGPSLQVTRRTAGDHYRLRERVTPPNRLM